MRRSHRSSVERFIFIVVFIGYRGINSSAGSRDFRFQLKSMICRPAGKAAHAAVRIVTARFYQLLSHSYRLRFSAFKLLPVRFADHSGRKFLSHQETFGYVVTGISDDNPCRAGILRILNLHRKIDLSSVYESYFISKILVGKIRFFSKITIHIFIIHMSARTVCRCPECFSEQIGIRAHRIFYLRTICRCHFIIGCPDFRVIYRSHGGG